MKFLDYIEANPGATIRQMAHDLGYCEDWCHKQTRALHDKQLARVDHWTKRHTQYIAHWIAGPGAHAEKPVVSQSAAGARRVLRAWLREHPRSTARDIAAALDVTQNYAQTSLRALHAAGQARIVEWVFCKGGSYALWTAEGGEHASRPAPIRRSNIATPATVARMRDALAGGELSTDALAAALGVTRRVANRAAQQCAHFVSVRYVWGIQGRGGKHAFYRLADPHECRPAPTLRTNRDVETPTRRIVDADAAEAPVAAGPQSWLSALGLAA